MRMCEEEKETSGKSQNTQKTNCSFIEYSCENISIRKFEDSISSGCTIHPDSFKSIAIRQLKHATPVFSCVVPLSSENMVRPIIKRSYSIHDILRPPTIIITAIRIRHSALSVALSVSELPFITIPIGIRHNTCSIHLTKETKEDKNKQKKKRKIRKLDQQPSLLHMKSHHDSYSCLFLVSFRRPNLLNSARQLLGSDYKQSLPPFHAVFVASNLPDIQSFHCGF